jgi:hypothetical protein
MRPAERDTRLLERDGFTPWSESGLTRHADQPYQVVLIDEGRFRCDGAAFCFSIPFSRGWITWGRIKVRHRWTSIATVSSWRVVPAHPSNGPGDEVL